MKPIMIACLNNDINTLKKLINTGEDYNQKGYRDTNLVQYSFIFNYTNLDCLKYLCLLISNGFNINTYDSYNKTPIMYACQKNNINAVKILLENGADMNMQDSDGYSAIFYAIWKNNIEILEILCQNKYTDINLKNSETNTPLMYACEEYKSNNNKLESIKILLKYNANKNITDINDETPLMFAKKNDYVDLINLLE